MTDEQFIEQFEACSLPAESFHHGQHVRVVWLYLRQYSIFETLQRFSESLKRFATSHGKPNLYHETISWAYVFLINERVLSRPQLNWEEFTAANPDLFDWQNSVLKTYYSNETLWSDLARSVFLMPDRQGQ